MAKFVCPECDMEIEGSEDELIPQAKQHMSEEHDKRSVSNDYIEDNIHAHA